MARELTLSQLEAQIRTFNEIRGWQVYHLPKNLACAVAAEAGELLELFQWLTPEQSESLDPSYLDSVASEMADVLIFLITLADVLRVDLTEALMQKLDRNSDKYPPGKVFDPFGKALDK